ncbi:hypothetical protein JYU34_001478 [Plutella xylostella]|uniref:Kazal-like domain-containing protein n=1 Tax=Plutella xylostella TaxID=51655 RepID=A0ABQ7R405_PLUXY|nr:hypothetical protein JYU34_001478 [Plutella xylostella]
MFFQLGAVLLLAAAAHCGPACGVCPFINQPLCGSDGRTYGNQCEFNCAQSKAADLTVQHHGDCEPHGRRVRGVTVVDAAAIPGGVQVAESPLPCNCPRNAKPVCGDNGHTYTNECLLNCQAPSTAVRHAGPCDRGSECDCSKEREPVCGSDTRWYGNRCLLECAQSKDPSVHEAHPRYCIDKDRPYLRSN